MLKIVSLHKLQNILKKIENIVDNRSTTCYTVIVEENSTEGKVVIP